MSGMSGSVSSGGAATETSPADALNEALVASLRAQLLEAGCLDAGQLTDERLLEIVNKLGGAAVSGVVNNPGVFGDLPEGGLLGMFGEARRLDAERAVDLSRMFHSEVRDAAAHFGMPAAFDAAGQPFPSPDEAFSFGDMPNGDFQLGGGRPREHADVGLGLISGGSRPSLAADQRQAKIDTFKTVVAGGLHWLSDAIDGAASRLTPSLSAPRPSGSTPRATTGYGGEWVELAPGSLWNLFPASVLRPFVPPGAGGPPAAAPGEGF